MTDATQMTHDALMTEVEAQRARLTTAERLLSDARGLIEEALVTHIYEDEDQIPEDCNYLICSRQIEAFLEGRALDVDPAPIDFLRPDGDAVIAAATLDQLVAAWQNSRAEVEGWMILHSDTYGPEIERDDAARVFATDDEAVAFVQRKAEAGSLYHQMAMAMHTRMADERQAACLAAGYRVVGERDDGEIAKGDEPVHHWAVYLSPDDMTEAYRGETREQAWAWAYRDLGERAAACETKAYADALRAQETDQ